MNSRDLIKRLEADGWVVVRIKGSHHHLKHPVKTRTITVPHPKKDLGLGLVKAILKDAEIL